MLCGHLVLNPRHDHLWCHSHLVKGRSHVWNHAWSLHLELHSLDLPVPASVDHIVRGSFNFHEDFNSRKGSSPKLGWILSPRVYWPLIICQTLWRVFFFTLWALMTLLGADNIASSFYKCGHWKTEGFILCPKLLTWRVAELALQLKDWLWGTDSYVLGLTTFSGSWIALPKTCSSF